MDPVAGFLAAQHTLSQIVGLIDAITARREEKRRQKALRRQNERRFLHDFSHVFAPTEDEEAQEEQTIRSRCKKLQNVIKNHWQFIMDRGPHSAQAGHASIANAMFHIACMPGLPVTPTTPTVVAEKMVPTYNRAQNELVDIINRLEDAPGYEIREINLRIERIGGNVKHGFAMGANVQATLDAAKMIAASNFGFQPAMIPSLDEVTSQTNLEDLYQNQSSPEDLKASYTRVEQRCVQSISRNVSPATTQPSISPASTSPSMNYNAFAALNQKLLPYATPADGGEKFWPPGQTVPSYETATAVGNGMYGNNINHNGWNNTREWRDPWR